MMPKTQERPKYLQVSLKQITESSLLSEERIQEVTTELNRRLVPWMYEGKPSKNFMIDTETMMGHPIHTPHGLEYAQRLVLVGILTDEEIDKLNDKACGEAYVAREAQWFEKAKKVWWEDYGGMVSSSCDEIVCEVADYVGDTDPEDLPGFAWAMVGTPAVHVDVDTVLEHMELPECYSDDSSFDGLDEFKAAAEKFVAANAKLLIYNEDHNVAVVFDAALMPADEPK